MTRPVLVEWFLWLNVSLTYVKRLSLIYCCPTTNVFFVCRLIILLYSYYYLKYFSFTEHVRLLKTSFQALLSSSSMSRPDEELSKVKFHTYIALLEVRGRLICGTLYITSPAGPLHPTLVWRFQEATNIPMQGGAWPVCPLMPWHYRYSFTPEWGEALSIWSKGVLNPSYLSFDSGQSRTRNLSHTSQKVVFNNLTCSVKEKYFK